MNRAGQIISAGLLTLCFVQSSYAGTISGSRTGTITGSRTGTITGSQAGTITGSRFGTITGSRFTVNEPVNETSLNRAQNEILPQLLALFMAWVW